MNHDNGLQYITEREAYLVGFGTPLILALSVPVVGPLLWIPGFVAGAHMTCELLERTEVLQKLESMSEKND